MSTNNGTATRNKRRRTDGDSATVEDTRSIVNPTPSTLTSALGKSDSPFMEFLALQSTELQDYIVSKTKEMAELVTIIRQRIDTN